MPVNAKNLKLSAALVGVSAALALIPAGASASRCNPGAGGISASQAACGPVGKAKLVRGIAIPPRNAPLAVRRAIGAANRIEKKPYIWGGGHGRWTDRGYDCSGAVSYALHGGRLLGTPLASGSLMSWGRRGAGRWISVYANSGHAYAVIAGLRWDTSMTPGDGPGWSKQMRSRAGYVVRHPAGY